MHVVGAFVNGAFFQTLGTRPRAGRLLAPADDRPDAPLAVAALPIANPLDPLLIVPIAAILALTALGAAWIPARRASLVNGASP